MRKRSEKWLTKNPQILLTVRLHVVQTGRKTLQIEGTSVPMENI